MIVCCLCFSDNKCAKLRRNNESEAHRQSKCTLCFRSLEVCHPCRILQNILASSETDAAHRSYGSRWICPNRYTPVFGSFFVFTPQILIC